MAIVLPDPRFEMPELFVPWQQPTGSVKLKQDHPIVKTAKLLVVPFLGIEMVLGVRLDEDADNYITATGQGKAYHSNDNTRLAQNLNPETSRTLDMTGSHGGIVVANLSVIDDWASGLGMDLITGGKHEVAFRSDRSVFWQTDGSWNNAFSPSAFVPLNEWFALGTFYNSSTDTLDAFSWCKSAGLKSSSQARTTSVYSGTASDGNVYYGASVAGGTSRSVAGDILFQSFYTDMISLTDFYRWATDIYSIFEPA